MSLPCLGLDTEDKNPAWLEDFYGQASNRASWSKGYAAKAEGLRRLHTSASLFQLKLKLHYSQCIPSLDAAVLHIGINVLYRIGRIVACCMV